MFHGGVFVKGFLEKKVGVGGGGGFGFFIFEFFFGGFFNMQSPRG